MDQWPDYAWEAMESWGTGQWTATLAEDFPWSQTPNWTPEHWNLEPIPGRVVRGIVWDDSLDGDGLYDFPFESTLVGRNVYLDVNGNQAMDAGDLISVTNAQGEYELYAPTLNGVPSLLDGSYTVTQLSNDPGWQITSPAGGSYVVLFDQPVQVYDGFDFGNQCVNNCLDEDDTFVLTTSMHSSRPLPGSPGPRTRPGRSKRTPKFRSLTSFAVSWGFQPSGAISSTGILVDLGFPQRISPSYEPMSSRPMELGVFIRTSGREIEVFRFPQPNTNTGSIRDRRTGKRSRFSVSARRSRRLMGQSQ